MMSLPLFDSKNLPLLFKAGLSISISIILFHILEFNDTPFFTEVIPFGIGVMGEIILGVIIGFSVRLLFAAVQLAGQLVGFQMGFAIANVIDPQTGSQVSIIAQFKNVLAILIFLAINAHHWFLRALAESFKMVPLFEFQFNGLLMEQLMRLTHNMFIIAVKIGAPIIAALLLTSVSLGLLARTVPQMNVFIVGFPLKIGIGFLFLSFSLPFFISLLTRIFNNLGNDVLLLLKAM